jgi:putative flippase GtrA
LLTEYFNVNYLLSASIGFLFGLIVNYILSIKWVFNERAFENKSLEFFIFTLIGLIGLGINQFLIWLLTDVFLLYFMVSKIITASIVYFWNFFARKFLLFNKSQHNNE